MFAIRRSVGSLLTVVDWPISRPIVFRLSPILSCFGVASWCRPITQRHGWVEKCRLAVKPSSEAIIINTVRQAHVCFFYYKKAFRSFSISVTRDRRGWLRTNIITEVLLPCVLRPLAGNVFRKLALYQSTAFTFEASCFSATRQSLEFTCSVYIPFERILNVDKKYRGVGKLVRCCICTSGARSW